MYKGEDINRSKANANLLTSLYLGEDGLLRANEAKEEEGWRLIVFELDYIAKVNQVDRFNNIS